MDVALLIYLGRLSIQLRIKLQHSSQQFRSKEAQQTREKRYPHTGRLTCLDYDYDYDYHLIIVI